MMYLGAYGKPGTKDEDVTIDDIIDDMKWYAKTHENDHPDCNCNAEGIDDYADDLRECWSRMKQHPEKWCDSQQCACRVEREKLRVTTCKAALANGRLRAR